MALYSKVFNTTIELQRRSEIIDNIGDYENTWSAIEGAINASIQPLSVKEINNEQGVEYLGTHKAYTDIFTETPKNHDRIKDELTNKIYDIVSVQLFKPPIKIPKGEHYKFILKIIEDSS